MLKKSGIYTGQPTMGEFARKKLKAAEKRERNQTEINEVNYLRLSIFLFVTKRTVNSCIQIFIIKFHNYNSRHWEAHFKSNLVSFRISISETAIWNVIHIEQRQISYNGYIHVHKTFRDGLHSHYPSENAFNSMSDHLEHLDWFNRTNLTAKKSALRR